jgi:hypothetical protein
LFVLLAAAYYKRTGDLELVSRICPNIERVLNWIDQYVGRLQEKALVTPAELLSTLRRYLEESSDSEQTIASQLGINHHVLLRWLSDKPAPEKEKVARVALFLRRAKYL